MVNPLLKKLANFTTLSDDERHAVDESCGVVRSLAPREDIIVQGQKPASVCLLLDGFACRYKALEDGRRQIVSFFVPGDLCDLRGFILGRMDHSIGALAASRLAIIAPDMVQSLTDRYPKLTRALWWSTLVEEAVLREWILNLGQRDALERMGSLFCELLYRFRAAGLLQGDCSFALPLTQLELGEALGLSAVHANRTLQALRRRHLVSFEAGRLTIHDLAALEQLALFDPDYLHLNSP
jgi:CRP-like cAMP-binding protein